MSLKKVLLLVRDMGGRVGSDPGRRRVLYTHSPLVYLLIDSQGSYLP